MGMVSEMNMVHVVDSEQTEHSIQLVHRQRVVDTVGAVDKVESSHCEGLPTPCGTQSATYGQRLQKDCENVAYFLQKSHFFVIQKRL